MKREYKMAIARWIGHLSMFIFGAGTVIHYQSGNYFTFYLSLSLAGLFSGLFFYNNFKIEGLVSKMMEQLDETIPKLKESIEELKEKEK